MIITKTPFRVSFCGGGSDMANFYEKYGGCVLSTSINKYCYISIHPYFNENQTLLKYSENELVDSPDQIKHRIFRQVLTDMGIHGVEISSTADIPGGTGLGSSSTFTVGLLNTLNCYKGKFVSKDKLAKLACEVEIEKLGRISMAQHLADLISSSSIRTDLFHMSRYLWRARHTKSSRKTYLCSIQGQLAQQILYWLSKQRT